MKIEKNNEGNGFVLTNSEGASLNVSFMEFWDICRAGTEIDTKNEVEEYLSQCPDISGHDLDRIRAFPRLVDKITEQVIEDRINDESGDQIYDAAEKCIKEHLSELEESLDMMKWFELSEDKCISVWYVPDKYDGDQFQMHLEQKSKDGSMGFGCEIISSDSYATANISFEAICETLSEICDDADILVDDAAAQFNLVSKVAENIFSEFEMDKNKAEQEVSVSVNNTLSVSTPLGDIVVTAKTDSEYPGVYVDLKGEKVNDTFEVNTAALATVEFDPFKGVVQSIVYGNAEYDEPSHIVEHENLEKDEKPGLDNIISDAEAKKNEIKPREENKNIEHEI